MLTRRQLVAASASALALLAVSPIAHAEEKNVTTLFKIITVKDDIIVGLSAEEMQKLEIVDAGGLARAIVHRGELTVWQYAVKKADNGDLQQAPRAKVGLIAHASLRVEPYASPLLVLPHE